MQKKQTIFGIKMV